MVLERYRDRRDVNRMQNAYGCHFDHLETEETEKGDGGSTFLLRLLLSLLLFGGFLWMHTEKRAVFGCPPEQAVEAISRNTDLQALIKSVRIEQEAR